VTVNNSTNKTNNRLSLNTKWIKKYDVGIFCDTLIAEKIQKHVAVILIRLVLRRVSCVVDSFHKPTDSSEEGIVFNRTMAYFYF